MSPIRLKTLVFGEKEITVVLPDRIADATPAPTPAPTRPPTNAAIRTTLTQPRRVPSADGSAGLSSAVGGASAPVLSEVAAVSPAGVAQPAAPRGAAPAPSSSPGTPPPSLST